MTRNLQLLGDKESKVENYLLKHGFDQQAIQQYLSLGPPLPDQVYYQVKVVLAQKDSLFLLCFGGVAQQLVQHLQNSIKAQHKRQSSLYT